MKLIGKEVLFLSTSELNPRNGEGAFIRLNDGKIMFAFTRYIGDDWQDHATACIAAVYSDDEGESWSEPSVLVDRDAESLNYMSVSLMRMQNGDIGLFYLRKSMDGDKLLCMPVLRRSADEGKTWSAPVACTSRNGYFVVNNDRFVRLSSGRIIVPAADCGDDGLTARPSFVVLFCSDDDGRTWQELPHAFHSPYTDRVRLQEPGIYEHSSGRLWVWFRTAYGFQYQSFSDDGGKTWTAVAPNFLFTSPDSPMQVKKIGDYTLAVFNPLAYNCLRTDAEQWGSPKRTPYAVAVSKNDGKEYAVDNCLSHNGGANEFNGLCYLLEDDQTSSYCYPALLPVKGGFLIAYYHSNGSVVCLNCTRIKKVLFSELD